MRFVGYLHFAPFWAIVMDLHSRYGACADSADWLGDQFGDQLASELGELLVASAVEVGQFVVV